MLRYGFFDSEISGYDEEGMPIFDRAESSDFLAMFISHIVSDGVLALPGDCFQVVADTGMNLRIRPGFGIVKGRFAYNDQEDVITIPDAPSSYKRIDRVVLRANYRERLCEIVVKSGIADSNPVPPGLLRPASGDYYELCLANVMVNSNQTIITQSSITDTRLDSNVCGLVTQLIAHLDTSVFYAQLNKFYSEFTDNLNKWYKDLDEEKSGTIEDITDEFNKLFKKYSDEMQEFKESAETEYNNWYSKNTENWTDEFYTWFNNLKEQVTENIAIHLQMQIGNLNGLETEAKDSLTNAINEVHTDIETTRAEIVADVEEKVDSIRVLNAEATITKPDHWVITFTKINGRSPKDYVPKDGDIIVIRFSSPYQGANFLNVYIEGLYSGNYPIVYCLNCYSTEVYTSPFAKAIVNIGYRNSIILNVVFKENAPYLLLLNDLPLAQTERYKQAVAYQFPQKNLFLQSGAISMYFELNNAINKRLECVESGEFTNDTVELVLDTGSTYLLATVEYTVSSKAIYGYRMCMIAVPQTGVNKAVSRANLVASTNAGVTLANVAPEDAGYVYREVTMKATSTYGVSYALYELDAYCTGDF